MQPNSLRKRIAYVAKQFPKVLHETAYVMAHTVGADRDAIERAIETREPIEHLFIEAGHPSEALIPWVAKELNAAMKEVAAGRLAEHEFVDLVNLLEAKLPVIAMWVEANKPDLTKLTAATALSAVAKFDPDKATPVPQGKVIYRFSDGWTVQELTKPEQIYAEGEAAQNCLRESASGPSYHEQVQKGASRIFSLRTPNGSPRVSMEFVVDPESEYGGRFEQVFAKQNTSLGASREDVGDDVLYEAIQKYKPRVREFIIEKFGGEPHGLISIGVPLPEGLTSVGGHLDLEGYEHPLPERLTSVGGSVYLRGYEHPLPEGLTSVGGHLYLIGYEYPLPEGLTSVGESLSLGGYKYPLPERLTSVGGYLDLRGYKHPLPERLTSVGGNLDLRGYKHPLPEGLTRMGGSLYLEDYEHPLPERLASVGGYLDLRGYKHPLPDGLTSVGGGLFLRGYKHPLPDGLISVGGSLDLEDWAED
jgi:hypothetical protein